MNRNLKNVRLCARAGWWSFVAGISKWLPVTQFQREWWDDTASLHLGSIAFLFSPVEVTGPPLTPQVCGWSCEHLSMTSIPGVLGQVSTWCGCKMMPIYYNSNTTAGNYFKGWAV